jgi:hypothetical protein
MTQQIDTEIYNLILRMLAVAPDSFKRVVDAGQINTKITEATRQLDDIVRSLRFIKHGTSGGREKYTKDLAATLLILIELLPLVSQYDMLNIFMDVLNKRLAIKETKKVVTTLNFGRVIYGKSFAYAAEIKYSNNDTIVVYLGDDQYNITVDEQVTKTFNKVKTNAAHSRINKRFALLSQAINKGSMTVNFVNKKLENIGV